MIKANKKLIFRHAAFIIAGALSGYLYYALFGCDGTCAITSSPLRSVLYASVLGLLLSQITAKQEQTICNT